MTRRFTIRDGAFDGCRLSLAELPAALRGMQAAVRARCTVVEWRAQEPVPADEWLERMQRAEMPTIPPSAGDEEVTEVRPLP